MRCEQGCPVHAGSTSSSDEKARPALNFFLEDPETLLRHTICSTLRARAHMEFTMTAC
jgi:hypothetical protein